MTDIDTLTQRYTTPDRTRYIRAIRSFSVLSNLGCEGVNQRCISDTGKNLLAFAQVDRKRW
jgi:hypothetical protein